MIRTWKMLGLQTVLGAALTAAPLAAGPLDGPESGKGADGIAKQLAELKKAIDELKNEVVTNTVMAQKSRGEILDLQKQIAELRQELESLKKQPTTRTSAFPPGPTGRVLLVNNYPMEMTILLNQVAYRLLPNETRAVVLPPGSFTFWVPGARGQQTVQNRTLSADETYTITVN